MGKVNKAWHDKHTMPKNPTLEQRLQWHLAHAQHCGCRAIPPTVLAEMKKRGIKKPALKT
jgi:hypothetical protein